MTALGATLRACGDNRLGMGAGGFTPAMKLQNAVAGQFFGQMPPFADFPVEHRREFAVGFSVG